METSKLTKSLYLIICLTLSANSNSSDFGSTGLIDIPTARMSADGSLLATAAIQSRTNSYSLTYQATPWLEGTFRYTGFNDFFYWDRNYEAKVRLLKEGSFLPQVAVGIRDLVGTGLYGSEYLVASKKIGKFDFTLGMGWGRLAGEGDFKNPLSVLSSRFDSRPTAQPGNAGTGVFQPGQWFSGEKAGLFGGLQYKFEELPLSIFVEHNPDRYDWDVSKGAKKPKSPVSFAMQWNGIPGISVAVSRQHNQEWGIELTSVLDTKSLPPKPSRKLFKSSLDLPITELPPQINKNSWYDTLLFDAERSGILLIEASIESDKRKAVIVMGNAEYAVWRDALDVMASLADLHLPREVRQLTIVVEEQGHRILSIDLDRPSNIVQPRHSAFKSPVKISKVNLKGDPQFKTNFAQKKVFVDIKLANRLQLFDPDDPARYQVYAEFGISAVLPGSWTLFGSYGHDITNNFDESTRVSNSVLQRVRSDVIRYLTEGDSGLDSLYIQKHGDYSQEIRYRIYAGLLESMYSGIGGEFLYQPFRSRFAFGLSANWVRQRDFDKGFNHLDYETQTLFSSVYWSSPFYNFDFAVHFGKYLAKDEGATLEIRRTFHNGWMVGVWATRTNVSPEDFGEGSFDKGFFFKIPLNSLFGGMTRGSYTTRIRPIQRDGGQYLEDFSSTIWWQTRAARYDAFSETFDR